MRARAGLVLFAIAAGAALWFWFRGPQKITSPKASGSRGFFDMPTPRDLAAFRQAPCATIRGRVTDAAGTPLRATISQYGDSWSTDASGAFELCFQPHLGAMTFAASGHASRTVAPARRRPTFDVVLERTGSIRGRVLEEDRDVPVAGVSVLGEVTSADGSFEMRGLAPGDRYLGGGGGDGAWRIRPVRVHVSAGETTVVTLRASRTFAVRGRVLDGEVAVRHTEVCLMSTYVCATTDGDGRFTLFSAIGEQRLGVAGHRVSPAHVNLTGPDTPELVLRVAPLDDVLATIRGRVTRLGVPVAGVMVGDTSTLADGSFVLRVPPGTITIEAHARELFALGGPITLSVVAGETREVDLELENEGAIGGVVMDQSGQPVPRALVRVVRSDGAEGASVRSRADGSFYLAPILPGVYRAEVWAWESVPFRDTPRAPITVATSSTQVTGLRFVVDTRVGTISGRVVDAAGRPVAGALVAAGGEPDCEGWDILQTDAAGRFTIGNLLLDAHVIAASDCDGNAGTVAGVEVGRDDVVVTVAGPPPRRDPRPSPGPTGRVIVRAVDDAGEPLSGIWCSDRVTGPDGTVVMDVVAGPFWITCEEPRNRLFRGQRAGSVAAGATTEITVPVLLR